MNIKKRFSYWWSKQINTQFQWGHPDDWDEAEWFYWEKRQR